MVVEKIFYHIITIRKNQYSNKNQQFLLYVKDEDEIRKSQIVKAIYMGFMFV